MTHRRLERAINRTRPQSERQDQEIPGVLGTYFEDEQFVRVPNRTGYYYVRVRNNMSEVVEALNAAGVSATYDLQVKLRRDRVDRSHYIITGRDFGIYPNGWSTDPYYTSHHSHHEFNPDANGDDIVWIYGQQFTPFLMYPTSSGTVGIYPYVYHDEIGWHMAGGTGTTDLLSLKPTGTSSGKMLLVYSDTNGNPQVLPGTSEFPSSYTYTSQIVPYLPDVPDDCRYVQGGVRLTDTTAGIVWANLYDIREHFNPASSDGDMTKAVYDADNDGIVDDAEELGGHGPGYYSIVGHTHSAPSPVSVVHNDFSGDSGVGAPNHLAVDGSNHAILDSSSSASLYFWKRTVANYKTVDKTVAYDERVPGSFVLNAYKIDQGQVGEQGSYVNAYGVAHWEAPATGTYTFTFTLRGGIKVWADGALIVDQWSPADETSTNVYTVGPESYTTGQTKLFEIDYWNGSPGSVKLTCEVDGPTYDWVLGGGEWRYYPEAAGSMASNQQLTDPLSYPSAILTLRVGITTTGSSYTSTAVELWGVYGQSGWTTVEHNDLIQMHSWANFNWRYTLSSTYGESTPTLSELRLDTVYDSTGEGDMLMATYDQNTNGIVDNSEALNGHADTYFAVAGHTHASSSVPTYPAIYDDASFIATGTAIHFNDNLSVVSSGTSVWINGSASSTSTGTHTHIFNEDHSSECNGATIQFPTDYIFTSGTTQVYLNGQRQRMGGLYDYIEGPSFDRVAFNTAPFTGDYLLIDYLYAAAGSPSTGTPTPPPATGTSGPYSAAYGSLPYRILMTTHTHTTNSDGSLSSAAYAAAIAALGFGALTMTDHNVVTTDPGGHGMVYIQGNEITSSGGHLISLGSDYDPTSGVNTQTAIDAIIAAGGVAILAHPKWTTSWTLAEMATFTGYHGIEIFNMQVETGATSNGVTNPGFDLADWDYVLTNISKSKWGFASDDYHSTTSTKFYNTGRTMLFCSSTGSAGIIASLQNGNFASDVSNYGVTLNPPTVTATGTSISCPGATVIRFMNENGLAQLTSGTSASYQFDADQYVRIEVMGDYTEDFADALDSRWQVNDGTWTVSGGIVSQTNGGSNGRYMLKRFRAGDFTTQFDVRLPDLVDNRSGIMFNMVSIDRFYWLALCSTSATYPNYHDRLVVAKTTDGTFSSVTPFGYYEFTPAEDTWYTIKMSYTAATGMVQAKVWETGTAEPGSWQIEASDTTWNHGGFGLRSVFKGDYDNLYINGFISYYQPIPVGDWE